MRQRDTINYFTAHHLEVAGALARPGGGQGRHAMRLADTVTAGRAEMIAAAPGRARQ
jgi:hypothetical protein